MVRLQGLHLVVCRLLKCSQPLSAYLLMLPKLPFDLTNALLKIVQFALRSVRYFTRLVRLLCERLIRLCFDEEVFFFSRDRCGGAWRRLRDAAKSTWLKASLSTTSAELGSTYASFLRHRQVLMRSALAKTTHTAVLFL